MAFLKSDIPQRKGLSRAVSTHQDQRWNRVLCRPYDRVLAELVCQKMHGVQVRGQNYLVPVDPLLFAGSNSTTFWPERLVKQQAHKKARG